MNGSGKHNNWSIATDDGTNLLNVQQLAEASGSFEVFPVVMAALVQAGQHICNVLGKTNGSRVARALLAREQA